MPKRSSKKPRPSRPEDEAQAAVRVIATVTERGEPREKNPAAVSLGRLGGLKGGPKRAKNLSAERRAEIAKGAALARWGKRLKTRK